MNNLIHDLCENVYYSEESIDFAYVLEIEREDFAKGLEKLKLYNDEDLPEVLIKSGYKKKDIIEFFEDVLRGSNNYMITL